MSDTIVAGKYRILRRLAAGGMGEVCLAAQMGPAGYERVVALKRMLPTLTVDRELLKLFLDEARLIALLNHRNICQIIELGEDTDGYFVAMEMINGPSVQGLLDRLRRSVTLLDPYYALEIAAQVAEALAYAYTAPGRDGQPLRIIHRDVTPHNVLLSTSGDVKLIDFGVAKSNQQQHSTESGTVKGKMGYLSPEQSMGRPLDGRSDLFSLGIMLYEMVTLTNPFGHADMMAMVRAIQLEDVAPLSSLNPRWAPFDPVLSRLLAKTPEHRYPDANAAAEALLDLRESFPRPARRLGVYVTEQFGAELAALARSVSNPDARSELEGTLKSSGAVIASKLAGDSSVDVDLARAAPTLYISGPNKGRPVTPQSADDSVLRKAIPKSRVMPVVAVLGVLWLVGLGVGFGSHRAPVPVPVAADVPRAPSSSPELAPVAPPLAVAKVPAQPTPPSIEAAAAPSPTPAPAEAPHHSGKGKHPKGEPAPTAAPVPATASAALGTLHVSGTDPRLLTQLSGHLDLQDASGRYRVGLDYTVVGSQVRAKLTTTPWAIVYVNGPSTGNTKERPVDLGSIGTAPLRIELEHPDIDRTKLVLSFDAR